MGLWNKAKSLAEQAPPERNRYVDFLRALSILAVVVGHWLVAAPYIGVDGEVVGGHLLGILPWTQWLTWGFQVMPIFFLVGGYSNGVSWASTRTKNGHYSDWFASRIQRLINPVFPVLLVWAAFAFIATQVGMARETVRMAVFLALIPVWFLSVYLLVTALAPLTWKLWEKTGGWSTALFLLAAVAVDWLTFERGVPYINFLNFLFVWLTIHDLGYAWQKGKMTPAIGLKMFAISLGLLIYMTVFGVYPIAMIGVPGADISNSMPPTLALLVLGMMQTGLVVAVEPWGRKLLDNLSVWTATVLMNGMIMTVYLWHLTSYVLVMVAAWLSGGVGLRVMPGTAEWWWSRPVWFALYIAVLLPLIAIFARYERGMGAAKRETPVPHLRLVIGMIAICVGLAMTAAISIASPEGVTGVRLWVVALPFVGAALVGFGPVYRWVNS
ncbi:acyltransferase [Qipengyuania sp. 1XM1-15A]|uniref:acyltransferase family protein n=1 Tax=Qipengyuania xiamenensis TaxID=2867237 RepID=UPI001C8671DB|nr:acyltransferase [Qipengyuania xiamenensis]MBX7531808.1 acyltransferase [Qipengyuania xiamenensis]